VEEEVEQDGHLLLMEQHQAGLEDQEEVELELLQYLDFQVEQQVQLTQAVVEVVEQGKTAVIKTGEQEQPAVQVS